MKTLTGLLLAAALLLAGCGEKSNAPAGGTNAASSGGNPLDAPADYLRGVANAQKSAVKTVDTASLDKAIQMFNVDQGRNPKDLKELVPKYIPRIPEVPYGMKLVYDADAGSVRIVKE
jgi:hypothetical protein